MDGQAYGVGKAGSPFNLVDFIKRPTVILRLFALLFSIIVFACISSKGYSFMDGGACIYGDEGACHYGVGIGITAMLLAIGFIVLEALFNQLSSVQHRKWAVMADIGLSGLWTFLWFVCFCYLAAKLGSSIIPERDGNYGIGNARSAIAFSFFSTGVWAGCLIFAIIRFRKGVTEDFGASDLERPDIAQSSNPYASFGGDMDQSYQPAPFSTGSAGGAQTESSEYQPPTY